MNITTKILFSLMFLVFGMFSSTVNASGLPMLKSSISSGDEYARRLEAGDVNGSPQLVSQALYHAGRISDPSSVPQAAEYLRNTEVRVCPQGTRQLSSVLNGRLGQVSRPYRAGEFCLWDRNSNMVVGSASCGNIDFERAPPVTAFVEPPQQQPPVQYVQTQPQQVPQSYIPPRQQQQVQVVYVDRSQPQQQVVYAEPQRRERFCDRHSRGCDIAGNVVATTLGTFLGNGLCNNNGWCRGNQGGSRRRYVDNNRLPPRRRPSEPCYDNQPCNNGGTQWRQTREWDDNNLSRARARSAIPHNDNGQWSF